MKPLKCLFFASLLSGFFAFSPCSFAQIEGKSPKETILTHHPAADRHPSWSPDGRKIAFESERDGNWEIYCINAEGSGLVRLTDNTAADRRPSWHPDGQHILFESDRNGKNELFLIDFNTLAASAISLGDFAFEPQWARFSPDGKWITFTANKGDGPQDLEQFVCQEDGSNVRQLTSSDYRSLWGHWSPNSKKIIFFSRQTTQGKFDNVFIINLNGKGLKRITFRPPNNFCPSWSADGRNFAFAKSSQDSHPELYISRINGSKEQRVTYNNESDTHPVWSPDGKYLAFTGFRNGSDEICILELEIF